jgi:hypothetical protein
MFPERTAVKKQIINHKKLNLMRVGAPPITLASR